jgi:DNA-binding CsgD family transcriptional regulator
MLRLFGEALELPILDSAQRHLLGGLRELVAGAGVVRCLIQSPAGADDVLARLEIGFEPKRPEAAASPGLIEPMLARCRESKSGAIAAVRRLATGSEALPIGEEVQLGNGIGEALVHVRAVGGGRFDGLTVYRGPGDPPFVESDLEVIRLFHHEVLARFAMPDQGLSVRLSPREQQTLTFLLRGARRKEIAAELGLSQHTVNEYVKSLYKRLGVSGLPELYFRFASDAPAEERRRGARLSREVA